MLAFPSSCTRAATSPSLSPFARLLRALAARAPLFARSPAFAGFYERLTQAERVRVGRLWVVVECLEAGDDAAAAEAASIIRGMPDDDDGDGSLAVRTFAEALLARVQQQSSGGGNLYLSARPPGAQLRAFELLRQRTSLVSFAYAAANRALLAAVAAAGPGPIDVTLLDVGIGRAGQVRDLLRSPHARRVLRSLHVIGVDPDSSAPTSNGALEHAERVVTEAGRETSIPTTFHGVARLAEELGAVEIHAGRPRGLFVATSAFTLHHAAVPSTFGLSGRDAVLRTVRSAGVRAMVLAEPDSNHFDDDLAVRLLFAYRHYRSVAKALEYELPPADAELVWGEFFAPEVRNVMAYDGVRRVERHEEIARWAERLDESGFTLEAPTRTPTPAGFSVDYTGGLVRLGFEGVSLVGVAAAHVR